MDGINRILRYVTWAIVPVAALLLSGQIRSHSGTAEAVSSVVAGLVGMVPQGLVLLTSVAFAAAAVTLARREVLVQELPAVEGLARVDVVCFDKTGGVGPWRRSTRRANQSRRLLEAATGPSCNDGNVRRSSQRWRKRSRDDGRS